jgi:hypothetical protein
MSDSLATIERRLDALEKSVADLRQRIPENGGASAGAWAKVEFCRTEPATLKAILEEVRKKMGIEGEPMSAEEHQRRMLEAGWDPTGNEFSREIVEMREE